MRAFIYILALLLALVCNAQAQEHAAKVIEVLPNDQFIIEVSGKQYRAINADKTVELAKQKIDLETCQANEKRFEDRIKIAEQNTIIASQRADIEHGNFTRAMAMFEGERKLRQESSQFIPHSKSNWLLNALDSPYSQAFWKIAIPLAQTIRVYTKD